MEVLASNRCRNFAGGSNSSGGIGHCIVGIPVILIKIMPSFELCKENLNVIFTSFF